MRADRIPAMYKLTGRMAGVVLKAYARRWDSPADSLQVQERELLGLVTKARTTRFGVDHDFPGIRTVADFQDRVPLRTYEDFSADYWASQFPLLNNCSWPGTIPYFARSSGTTTGESKFIPVSDQMVKANNAAGLQVLLHHLRHRPQSTVVSGRTFLFGGSPRLDQLAPGVFAGDLSGIAAKETPRWAGRDRYYPPPDLAAIGDWEEKVERLARDCVGKDIRSISGVPTWLQILFDRAFTAAAVTDHRLVRLFPDLELITHGGINFAPYADHFAELVDGSRAELREVYAASEGFIAIADRDPGQGLRLLLGDGVFFEFVEVDQLDQPHPDRRWIADVELNKTYALVLSSCAGLWAYVIGDLVRLVDRNPPRLLVAGRVSQSLSAFGEHIIGEELELAVTTALQASHVGVRDFTVAPVFDAGSTTVGWHHYLIEVAGTAKPDPAVVAGAIDRSLSAQNADYRSKRAGGIAIGPPVVTVAETGTFAAWMSSRGRLGGQNKVPRVTDQDQLRQILSSQ